MEKFWESVKKIGIVIATALSAVALVLLGKESWRRDSYKKKSFNFNQDDNGENISCGSASGTLLEEKIEGKCNEKRNETLERLSNTDARVLSENYGAVCDAITDGKLRFRNRCRELDGKGNSDYGNR